MAIIRAKFNMMRNPFTDQKFSKGNPTEVADKTLLTHPDHLWTRNQIRAGVLDCNVEVSLEEAPPKKPVAKPPAKSSG